MKLLISNFNTVPRELIDSWGEDWLLLDQSTDEAVVAELTALDDPRVVASKHVGHNLLDYINYFVSNYENLPDTMVLAKGNIVPRHIDAQAFRAAVRVGVFSPLYRDRTAPEIKGTQHFPVPNLMFEVNNSWYANKSTHRYFTEFDQLMDFLFDDYVRKPFIIFNPGACFIVEAKRVRNYSKAFWQGLSAVLSYGFFPAEAWMVERALYSIFTANLTQRDYFGDEIRMQRALAVLPDRTEEYVPGPGPLGSLKKLLHR